MNQLMGNVINIICLNGVVLIVPGANFMLIVRHATTHGRQAALFCVLGITTAIMMHVVLSYCFIGYILLKYQHVFELIKYAGAIYLLYLAINLLRAKQQTEEEIGVKQTRLNKKNAFTEGFLIDLLNPFVIFFYVSLLATVITSTTTISEISVYFLTILLLTFLWFMAVGVFFSFKNCALF